MSTDSMTAEGRTVDLTTENDWVIRKGGYFYRPNAQGYTVSILEAGRYMREEAEAHAAASSGEVTARPASEFPDPVTETVNRIVAELKWIVAHAVMPRSREEIANRAQYAISLALRLDARAALKQD